MGEPTQNSHRYVFVGPILPETAQADMSPQTFQFGQLQNLLVATLWVQDSMVMVSVESPKPITDSYTVRNNLDYSVGTLVATLGFANGSSLDVLFTAEVTQSPPLVFGPPTFVELAAGASESRTVTFDMLIRALGTPGTKAQALSRALLDYKSAIQVAYDTALYCYRAIEALSVSFGESKTPRDSTWKAFRTHLNIDRSYTQWLENISKQQRHGLSPFMSHNDRLSALSQTREVILRFSPPTSPSLRGEREQQMPSLAAIRSGCALLLVPIHPLMLAS